MTCFRAPTRWYSLMLGCALTAGTLYGQLPPQFSPVPGSNPVPVTPSAPVTPQIQPTAPSGPTFTPGVPSQPNTAVQPGTAFVPNPLASPGGFDPYSAPSAAVVPGPALPPAPSLPSNPFSGGAVNPLAPAPAVIPVRFVLSGELLYLRASDAAMTNYAVPVSNVAPLPTIPIPMGPVAFVEQDMEAGFRVGLDWIWNDYSRWVATYSSLDLNTMDMRTVTTPGPVSLQALVLHPSTPAAGELYDSVMAAADIELDLGDIEYRRVYVEDWYRWDFLVGARYASLDQRFTSEFANIARTETVDSDVRFEGGGIRFGTRGDWRSNQHGFFVYAGASTSFVAGRFRSQFQQTDDTAGIVAMTSRRDDRIVNITDAELGLGWRSPTQRFWFFGGYLFETWDDVVNPAGVIRSAQSATFQSIRERLTFDGFVGRLELRF